MSTSPLPFIGITPCRVADTRGNGFTGAYGPPALVGNGPARSFNIPSGPCSGIPANAGAFSINVTAVLPFSDGFMTIFPTGAAQPTSSDLNFLGGRVIANAIVASAGTGGAISVFVNVSTDFVLDINGYYAPAGAGADNTFLGRDAGNFTMTGVQNTGIGTLAFRDNTIGTNNTAIGVGALSHNTVGNNNLAAGFVALFSNISGGSNTAVGGLSALGNNTSGSQNTAIGNGALSSNSTGNSNTAIGVVALDLNTSGFQNIAVGEAAGQNLTTGDHNIDIGNPGVTGESATIRIGSSGTHTRAFLAGIRGVTTSAADGLTVLIDSNGQLGTMSSSASAKREILDIGEASSPLLNLRPVSFYYRDDTERVRQYGLIAEEVARVMPELVQFSTFGSAETVRYHFLATLLLNELQRQHRSLTTQESAMAQQKAEIEELHVRLSRLESRLLANPRR